MFEDSILESAAHTEARRGWSALTAAGLQLSLLALLALMPLLKPALIVPAFNHPPVILTRIAEPPSQPEPHAPSGSPVIAENENVFRAPTVIPKTVFQGRDNVAAPALPGAIPCSANCIGDVISSVGTAAPPQPPKPQVFHVSHYAEGGVLVRVQPEYPLAAKIARIQGNVILSAVVGKDGTVQELQVVSGHPMLAGAAVRAVSQWKFRPYVLDGAPVEVATQITVHFTLSGE